MKNLRKVIVFDCPHVETGIYDCFEEFNKQVIIDPLFRGTFSTIAFILTDIEVPNNPKFLNKVACYLHEDYILPNTKLHRTLYGL